MYKDFPDISVAEYLGHRGFDLDPGQERINAPYREDADSGSFCVGGDLWFDHVEEQGGNVWQLALKMNKGDRLGAMREIYAAAGMAAPTSGLPAGLASQFKAEEALEKVRDRYGVDSETDTDVLNYLKDRGITEKSWRYLAYIPSQDNLEDTLTREEVKLTGLGNRKGKIILWYLRNDRPVYYCTRALDSKEFKKALTGNLSHPIWNVDALYSPKDMVWAEGFFDVLSLMELGYEVAGEITCNLIESHKEELLKALRFRNSRHPNSKFIICLDNDQPNGNGRRAGNVAAEKIAGMTLEAGCTAYWVKHDPAGEKQDINDLHARGMDSSIHQMLSNAKPVMDILTSDPERLGAFILASLNAGNVAQASALLEKAGDLKNANGIKGLSAIVKSALTQKRSWKAFYDNSRIDLTFWNDTFLVRYKNVHDNDASHCFVKTMSNLKRQIAPCLRNRSLDMNKVELDISVKEPVWKVEKDIWKDDGNTVNLFRPSPLLLQRPVYPAPSVPPMWDLLLDNLAGAEEKAWLLNHMATYVQTLEKARTIPVLYGEQGTGKNTLAECFAMGLGIDSYASVDKQQVESQFNDWLVNSVVLVDEIYSKRNDLNKRGALMKPLVNSSIRVNIKYAQPYQAKLNNYILVASNPIPGMIPVPIEENDRRYSIITGGDDINLQHVDEFDSAKFKEELPQFMLHLLSREIDVDTAGAPLESAARQRMIESARDRRVGLVRDYLVFLKDDDKNCSLEVLRRFFNRRGRATDVIDYNIDPRTFRELLEAEGIEIFTRDHQFWVRGVSDDFTQIINRCRPVEEETLNEQLLSEEMSEALEEQLKDF